MKNADRAEETDWTGPYKVNTFLHITSAIMHINLIFSSMVHTHKGGAAVNLRMYYSHASLF